MDVISIMTPIEISDWIFGHAGWRWRQRRQGVSDSGLLERGW